MLSYGVQMTLKQVMEHVRAEHIQWILCSQKQFIEFLQELQMATADSLALWHDGKDAGISTLVKMS